MSEPLSDKAHWFRDKEFSALILIAIQLVADTHPEELRRAIGAAFDLSAVEDRIRRIMGDVEEAVKQATEARCMLAELQRDLEQYRDAKDGLANEIQHLISTVEKA